MSPPMAEERHGAKPPAVSIATLLTMLVTYPTRSAG